MNKNLKGISYFLLASMFLISSCKKDEKSLSSNKAIDKSDVNDSKTLLNNLTNTSESGFFNYLESIPYNQAVDTLKKFIKKKSVVPVNKTIYSKSLNTTSSSDEPTPEELQQFVCIASVEDLYIDEPGLLSDGYKKVINVTWNILTGYKNLYRVDSKEQIELTYSSTSGPSMIPNVFVSDFHHSGSYFSNSGPVLLGSWSETVNEHFPMSFGPGTHTIGSHVQGVVTLFSIMSTNASNWKQFNAY